MAFLVPAFLAGLLAIAIPIWVHLRNRQKTEVIAFPSLMFLERIPYRSVQRQTLRHRLLFATRVLALGLLALAFARPFFGAAGPGPGGPSGAREVVVLIDRSWSMGFGPHWDRALAAASDAVAALAAGDRVSLVMFDEEAAVLVESTPDRAVAQAALQGLAPSHAGTRYAAGFRAAQRILADSALARREVVLISDFQRAGWDPDAELELPQGTVVRPLSIGEQSENISLTDITLRRVAGATSADAESVVVVARISRQGGQGELRIAVSLEVEGLDRAEREVELAASGAGRVEFEAFEIGARPLRGTVRAGSDPLPGDNVFHFVVAPGQTVPLLMLENPAASGSDSLFLERAMRIGSDPTFRIERRVLSDLSPRDLAGTSVVVLNDVGALDPATTSSLLDFLARGGGLIVAVAELTPERAADALLPFAVRQVADRSQELGATLAYLDTAHPALELFGGPEGGDFTTARFYRYRSLDPVPDRGVLARFDDGAVALAELTVGRGRVLVWTSSLDNFWTDFPLQPIFLPFVHQITKYVAAYREPAAWVPTGRGLAAQELVLAASSGNATGELSQVSISGSGLANGAVAALEPGFHELSWIDSSRGEGTGFVALNLDRAEADLARIDPEEVAAAAVWRAGGSVERAEAVSATAEQIEGSQSVWWYLLVLAFILLAVETALSNRLSPRAS